MSKQEFWTHWVIGIAATAVWFWGAKAGIPLAAQELAAAIVPGLVGHALNKSFRVADSSAPAAAPAAPQQPSQPE